jgi:hypothetical protein
MGLAMSWLPRHDARIDSWLHGLVSLVDDRPRGTALARLASHTMTALPLAGAAPDLEALAADAYVFGYPLVLMDVTRRVATATAAPDAAKAPINAFLHARTCPDRRADAIAPELDTLASTAWLDLSMEPIVLGVPCLGRRYYVMQLCDAWTNVFASPGTRTTGATERDFVIVGPHARDRLPRGVTPIRAPTDMVGLFGRTLVAGPEECAAVHAIQAHYSLTPMSAIGGPFRPPASASSGAPLMEAVDTITPPTEQVAGMHALAFFRRLVRLMTQNPPAAVDITALSRFAPLRIIGRTPREKVFEANDVPQSVLKAIQGAARIGHARIVEAAAAPHDATINRWRVSTNLGRYGTNYLRRAATAMTALGASLPEDAIHFHASEDGAGEPLTGAKQYVLRFARGQLPPVHACWSVTMYDARQRLVEGTARHKIGSRDRWTLASDGALVIQLQRGSPGADKASNWLPAPAGPFMLTMRLHWPCENALDGAWVPPAIRPVP